MIVLFLLFRKNRGWDNGYNRNINCNSGDSMVIGVARCSWCFD
jgi:hypothetical protein